jgi:hypothetical protein
MDFFINKNSTLPLLCMELITDGRNDYKAFNELIQNATITFSMIDIETGIRKVSKQLASCELKDACVDCPEEYYIIYKWKPKDVNRAGTYKAEFEITFLDGSGVLIAPVRDDLLIHIRDGAISNC